MVLILFSLFFFPNRYQKRVSNIIDDVLEWSPRLALSGMMDKQTGVNETDYPNNVTTDGGAETMTQADDTVEETIADRFEEEDVTNVGDSDQHH